MLRCGLLGRKLGHSYSPQIHRELSCYEYKLYEKEPEELEAFLKSGTFDGLNVTIPYKKTVMAYLDEISPGSRCHRKRQHDCKPRRQTHRLQHRRLRFFVAAAEKRGRGCGQKGSGLRLRRRIR